MLSGAAPAEARARAMGSLHEHLVHDDARLVQLLDPPFDTSTPSPGYIQGYVPGVRENGGQYTHAAHVGALAFAALGDGERAWELFGLLAPMHHGDSAEQVATYKVEPYVVAGDVYACRRTSAAAAGPGTPARPAGCTSCSSNRCSASSGAGTDSRAAAPAARLARLRAALSLRRSTYGIAVRLRLLGARRRSVRVDGVASPDGLIALVDEAAPLGRGRRVASSHAARGLTVQIRRRKMQLGMIGLGRMGANMVRRLLKNGHECVVFDMNPAAVAAVRRTARPAPPRSPSWSRR